MFCKMKIVYEEQFVSEKQFGFESPRIWKMEIVLKTFGKEFTAN